MPLASSSLHQSSEHPTKFISHDDDDDASDSENPTKKSKKPKRKKKKVAGPTKSHEDGERPAPLASLPEPTTVSNELQTESQATMTASERRALKKAKQKEKKVKEDELDQALAELSIQYVSVILSIICNS